MNALWPKASIAVFALLACLAATFTPPLTAATSQPSAAWQVAGQIGGPTQAVAVQGDYAYVGVGLRLVVLYVTELATLVEVGATLPFPHSVEDIAISGTRAYVAAGGAGLRVLDISNPANPTEIAVWDSPGYAEGVAVSGSTVFLADGPYGLWVVDVSDPTRPILTGSAYDDNYALEVAVAGSHAYIAAAGAGLLVADITDPARPVEVSGLDTPGYAYGVAVSGGVAYIADAWGGLHLVDVSDPALPRLTGSCPMPGWALGVAVAGETAYVAAGASGMSVVDVSDPASPQEIGALTTAALARRIDVYQEVVYLADLSGVLRIDVSDPQQPEEIGHHRPLVEARYVAVDGGYAYVAAGFAGLRIVDVIDPARPHEVAVYDTKGAYATGVVVSGAVAYIATMGSGLDCHGLHILDISDPLHPASLAVAVEGGFRGIAAQGRYVYGADEWGLRVIDVADPAAPTEVGFIQLAFASHQVTIDVTVAGELAYVANSWGGMAIVDVSTPAHPLLAGAFVPATWTTINSVAVSGHTAGLSSGFNGLHIVDVSDPSSPVALANYDTPGYAVGATISERQILVSDGGGGLQVVDISNPVAPILASSYDTRGFVWHATMVDDHVYLADSRGGLLILKPGAGHQPSSLSPLRLAQPATNQAPPASHVNHTLVGLTGSVRKVTAAQAASSKPETSTPLITGSTTHIVTSPLDSGPGTLRQALLDANTGDAIRFDPAVFPPSHPVAVTLHSELPHVNQGSISLDGSHAGVILDGAQLSGAGVICGLLIRSDHNIIRGLQFRGFTDRGLCIDGKHNTIGGDRRQGSAPTGQGNQFGDNYIAVALWGAENTFLGNLVGVDANGHLATGNWVGIEVHGQANRIGGPPPGEHNVISANSFRGIQILGEHARFNVVAGNYIGTDIDGEYSLGNVSVGVIMEIQASHNVIGGVTAAERNLISGNLGTGVSISDPGSTHNTVIGNWIGVDASGARALGNNPGIHVNQSGFNRIGGAQAGEGNVLSGNRGSAIALAGFEYSDNLILGNLIGLTADGAQPLGNGTGISLHVNTRRTFVGGATEGERNFIADNDVGVHIEVAGTDDNWLLGNVIGTDATGTVHWGNQEAGIVVEGSAARTTIQGNTIAFNGDAGFGRAAGVLIANSVNNTLRRNAIYSNAGAGIVLASGGNDMLPAPVIHTVTETAVTGVAYPGCVVEVFSDAGDQGRVYEGSTRASQEGRFAFEKGWSLAGAYVTATATDSSGNTSEFSAAARMQRALYLPLVCTPADAWRRIQIHPQDTPRHEYNPT